MGLFRRREQDTRSPEQIKGEGWQRIEEKATHAKSVLQDIMERAEELGIPPDANMTVHDERSGQRGADAKLISIRWPPRERRYIGKMAAEGVEVQVTGNGFRVNRGPCVRDTKELKEKIEYSINHPRGFRE